MTCWISLSLILFFTIFYSFLKECQSLCLNVNETISWERKFYFKDKIIPIVIEVSPRPSHKIVSNIISILLRERLGYNMVEFNHQKWDSTNEVIRRFSCQYNQCQDGCPVSHINVEVWKSPNYTFDKKDKQYVVDCGPLGPKARKGLFVKSQKVTDVYSTNRKDIDNWKFFKACQHQSKESCLTVYKTNFIEMEKELDALSRNLYNTKDTSVSYISNLGSVDEDNNFNGSSSKEPTLHLDWYPNVLTVHGNFTRVLFPDCWDTVVDNVCDFEVNQLSKLVWNHIKDHASKVYHLIREFMVTQEEYVDLLKNVRSDSEFEYYRVACNWVQNNRKKWYNWTPGWNVKDKVYLPILISDYGPWKASETYNASVNGINNLNHHFYNNTHYEIVSIIKELTCDVDNILYYYLKLIETYGSSIIGFIICLCPQSFNTLVKISDMQNRIVISASVVSINVKNVSQYQHFFSTSPNMVHYNLVLINLFNKLNWKRVIILANDKNFINDNLLTKGGINVLSTFYVDEKKINYNETYEFLEIAKRVFKASIFIVDYSVRGTQIVMCAAGNLGMNLDNSYVFILNPIINPHWWHNSTATPCKDNKKILSKEYFIIKHDTTSEHRDNYIKNNIARFSYLAQMTHDAILYLGKSFDQLLKDMPSAFLSWQTPLVSQKYIKLLSNQKQMMIGANVRYDRNVFNQNHDRNGIWQFQQIASFGRQYLITVPIFKWEMSFTRGVPVLINVTKVSIYLGKLNRSLLDHNQESNCPVETVRLWLNWSSCTTTLIFINVMTIAVLVILLLSAWLYYFFYQPVQNEDRNKKPFEDLCAELADIDIRSTDVIINLQVGQGAFGIVYGGEAKRNNHWESVAIKLIKKETNYQGKIDFLTEAKLMKNLAHPNIVKLIGICLNPPKPVIYLVMELVVNGDLEDHLLSHRITAQQDPTNKLVCSSLLTRFVKDIASGAHYLHQNNLLHRDLACRNCFLSEDYVVKIGDFGLTRNINDSHESQYYRTSRHFVLPARWMPPEAVQYGYFSIKSDIWSLGVIIFEIATFCSRPYYNVSDEDVPELVKRNTMPLVTYLPESSKGSHVYKLIETCCHYRKEGRPESMENIIKYLDENPECIKPYLTIGPSQHHIINIGNTKPNWINPLEISQRTGSVASGGLSKFKSNSRSRHSAGNWGIYCESQNNFESFFRAESEIGFKENAEQIPFIPCEEDFITINRSAACIGSKKRHRSGSKKAKSNLNSSKSRSSDFMTKKIEDDHEPSYVSCPDQDNIHHILGDIDPRDFTFNEEVAKQLMRSASGDEKSFMSGKRFKAYRNGKIYSGSSRNRKVKININNQFNKSKSKLSYAQGTGIRKISEPNGLHHELIQPLLFDRQTNILIQPEKPKNLREGETC